MKVEKTLYEQLMKAITIWCKSQPEKVHLQFILGTLERVKLDYYNNFFGSVHTLNNFLKVMKNTQINIGEKDITIFRNMPKPKTNKK